MNLFIHFMPSSRLAGSFCRRSFTLVSLWMILCVPAAFGQMIIFQEDFESGQGKWIVDNGVWEIGIPGVGPDSAHSGKNVAGTVLNGNYPRDANSRLISPKIKLDELQSGEHYLLKFWHWFSFGTADVGNVQISTDGGNTWQTISVPRFDDMSPVWTQRVLDLSAYKNLTIQIAFYFQSDGGSSVSTGWYIDDISVVKDFYKLRNPEDFEIGVTHWSADNGVWEIGMPGVGPASAHSGKAVAGTVLNGNYPRDANSRLISPKIKLEELQPYEHHLLKFWHWFSFGTADVGNVQISTDSGRTWQTISAPQFDHMSPVWTLHVLDLSAYQNSTVQIAFYFRSDGGSSVGTGWYIDDVSIVKKRYEFRNPEDFELGVDCWSADNGVWEIGVPGVGPASAHSGKNVAGTVLNGNYPRDANTRLISPKIKLDELQSGEHYLLKYWQWFSLGTADVGNVQISTDSGSTWQTISAPQFDHASPVWTQHVLDLSTYQNSTVQIAFYFDSDGGSSVGTGWYIDDISIVKNRYEFRNLEDFELGVDCWSADNGVWEIGVPGVGPDSAHSGKNVAGTVLNGNYPRDANSRLISPKIKLDELQSGEHYLLKYWQWFSFGTADVGNVQISTDGGSTWQTISAPRFDDMSPVWTQHVLDLSAYQNSTIQITFYFISDGGSSVSTGWYVDDVAVVKNRYEFRNPEDFELGVDCWSADNGVWEIGVPGVGPDSAHSGKNVAGTVLNGNYPRDANTRLISPKITLGSLQPGEKYLLKFWHWFSFGTSDFGNVQISTDGGSTWQTISAPRFDDMSPVWTQHVLDLSAYQNSTIQIAFYFISDGGSSVSTGWYVDDVAVVKNRYEFRNPEDFELGVDCWSADNGVWEIGMPGAGPDSAHSGKNVAGTVLNGNYPRDANSRLISPEIKLGELQPGEHYLLKFWHWFSFGTSDFGNMQITTDGGKTWQTESNPRFDDKSLVWTLYELDLSAYQNSTIQIAFYFISDGGSSVSSGWYIDDIEIDTTGILRPQVNPSSVDFGDVQVGDTATAILTVTNPNADTLAVGPIRITGVDSAYFCVTDTTFKLGPSESARLEVKFKPYTIRSFNAVLEIDSEAGKAFVSLMGNGVIDECPSPSIAFIKDVPNDQGKQVNVLWNRACGDTADSQQPITSYSIWRRADELGKTSTQAASRPPNIKAVRSFAAMMLEVANIAPGTQFAIAANTSNASASEIWTFVGSTPALQFEQYAFVAPTLYDSTATAGIVWTTFFVAAHTSDPLIWYASKPDSGYSVDNLAPFAPSGLIGTAGASTIALHWKANTEDDLQYYAIYRATTANFKLGEPLGYTIDTMFVDKPPKVKVDYYYKIAAVDFSGNESKPSNEVGMLKVSVTDNPTTPLSFTLEQNYPNPFNPETTILYELPRAGQVEVAIFNLLGERIRTLVNQRQEAGQYRILCDGRNENGKSMPSGVYLYRLRAGEFVQTRKMILMQ